MSDKPPSSPVELVYAFDPLCGWCFGFMPTFEQVRAALGHRVLWSVRSGGLVTGARVRPIGETRGYLLQGLAAVEATTGVRSGPGFQRLLDDGRWVSDSTGACRALFLVQQSHGGAKAIDFGSALCRGFYVDGLPPDAPTSITRAAELAEVEAAPLLASWSATDDPGWVTREFELARRAGIRSYPSLFLETEGGLVEVSSGCRTVSEVLAALAPHAG